MVLGSGTGAGQVIHARLLASRFGVERDHPLFEGVDDPPVFPGRRLTRETPFMCAWISSSRFPGGTRHSPCGPNDAVLASMCFDAVLASFPEKHCFPRNVYYLVISGFNVLTFH